MGRDGGRFEIRVRGFLDPDWSGRLGGMAITPSGDGETLLAGWVTDQAALHGILARIGDLNLELVSVRNCTGPKEGKERC